ncbi:MAG TPA: hypothetical protein DCS43_10045 [Verrucomicrobia bacterium]|nr:hypothetical protein [Verrucomicrobiota bacterium]
MIKPSFRSLMMKGADQFCGGGWAQIDAILLIVIIITILPYAFTQSVLPRSDVLTCGHGYGII